MEAFVGRIQAPDFPEGLDWLNTVRALSLPALRGKVVLLDFWAFCCINCHHNMPELRRLARRFPDELVVIGVHSAKFSLEQSTPALHQAVLRHEIDYPVVNDHRLEIWNAYKIRAWPTLILIAPDGCLKAWHAGEILAEHLAPTLERMIEHFAQRGVLDRRAIDFARRAGASTEPLRFPSKVLASVDGHLFVADTGHHRLLELALDPERRRARIRRVFGTGEPGLVDGGANEACFQAPHGLARWGSTLFVADTGNHAIRAVDLIRGHVRTLAGTGAMNLKLGAVGPPLETALRSPWDLCCHRHNQLYVAMAGSHQIYALRAPDVPPGAAPEPFTLSVFAGTGREALIDDLRRRAAFNQPSGLAASRGALYIADAEASAVRVLPLHHEAAPGRSDFQEIDRVETLVGTGLFDFGDRDGTGLEAQLQHPTGIALHDGWLYLADTYNHKIKRLDPASREVRSLIGDGQSGLVDGNFDDARFSEPEGLSFEPGRRRIYVADTNNHRIRVADLDRRELWTLELEST